MALSFTRLSWLWLGGKPKDKVSNGECGLGFIGGPEKRDDGDVERRARPYRKKAEKRKWKSRNERVITDKDHDDSVLVPSDGLSLSGSESDWSIGWLEPHAPSFQSDDSFAVLVPCYRHGSLEFEERGGTSTNPSGGYSEGKGV